MSVPRIHEAMTPEGISFLHLPDDCKSNVEIKEKYGDKTMLIGRVDPTWRIDAPEEDLRAVCREQIDAFKTGGGFMLATGCEYPCNADFRAAEIIVDMARTYGRYL